MFKKEIVLAEFFYFNSKVVLLRSNAHFILESKLKTNLTRNGMLNNVFLFKTINIFTLSSQPQRFLLKKKKYLT